MGVDGRDEELFWQHVQRSYRDAEESNDLDYAEAEALLQECEDAEPLPDEQVDRIVQRAMAMERELAGDAAEASPARPGWHLLKGAGRPLRGIAAAAVALASMPKLLIAGTAAVAIAVAVTQLRNTWRELTFDDALTILATPSETEHRRETAQGRVYFNVIEPLLYLRRLSEQSGELQPVASAAWAELVALAEQTDPTSQRPGLRVPDGWGLDSEKDPIMALLPIIENDALSLASRKDAVMRLARHAAQGIQALYTVSLQAGDGKLHDDNAAHLRQIRRVLRK